MDLTPEASEIWESYPPEERDRILAHGFCTRCLAEQPFTLEQGEMRGRELALIGRCTACGARVVRLISKRIGG